MQSLNQFLAIGGFFLALGSNIVWCLISYGNIQKKGGLVNIIEVLKSGEVFNLPVASGISPVGQKVTFTEYSK